MIIVIKATKMVAIRTPLARDSLLVFKNKKKAPKFRSDPILTSFVNTPIEMAIFNDLLIDSPVPKNNKDSINPIVLATMPVMIPMTISLFFKGPSV